MEQIIIQVSDRSKTEALLRFLRSLEFIEKVSSADVARPKGQAQKRDSDFFALAGLWAGRDVTIDSIRQKAWPVRQ